jgi:hypothetical protein
VRDDQSAYHEYFLAIQVEEGQPFMLDELNVLGNFDTGWWNPFRTELGLSVKNIQIFQPAWEETNEEIEEEETEIDTGNEEEGVEEVEEVEEVLDTGNDEPLELDESKSDTIATGCSSIRLSQNSLLYILFPVALLTRRRR